MVVDHMVICQVTWFYFLLWLPEAGLTNARRICGAKKGTLFEFLAVLKFDTSKRHVLQKSLSGIRCAEKKVIYVHNVVNMNMLYYEYDLFYMLIMI